LTAFGPQGWWPADNPLEVIIGAVLTQGTAWTNVERALANLKRRNLISLDRLVRLPVAELAPVIRPSGFYHVKARRLQSVLSRVAGLGGIAGLNRLRTEALRTELLACPGVGPETADTILLYAFARPVFVIDAYTRRILYRYGIAADTESYAELQHRFESHLPRDARLYNEYHALLVRLAKTHCRATPDCSRCPLA
jgi:endonuclease-3 related protein